MPVSMQGAGRGLSVPVASRSYCMNTRFQISSQRSHSHSTPRHCRPAASSAQGSASPWWKWISEQGPQGPVSPMAQKLSLAPELEDAVGGHVRQPEAVGLGVAGHAALALEDRDLQAVLGQAEVPR